MSTRRVGPRPGGASWRSFWGGWLLLVLFLQSACATGSSRGDLMAGSPRERIALTPEPGLESASVYAVDFLEPGAVSTRPVPIPRAEFQPAVQRL